MRTVTLKDLPCLPCVTVLNEMGATITEFDEQATSKKQALINYWRAYAQYIAGKETAGVVDGYERAARNAGVTTPDFEMSTVHRMVELAIERNGSCWRGSGGGFYSCPAGICPDMDAIRFYPD